MKKVLKVHPKKNKNSEQKPKKYLYATAFTNYFTILDPAPEPIIHKGWEPTFLIRAFGLSEELSTKVGFAFSNNGLKSKIL